MNPRTTRLSKKQWDEYMKKSDENWVKLMEELKPKPEPIHPPEPIPIFRPVRPMFSNSAVLVVITSFIMLVLLLGIFQTCQCQAMVKMKMNSTENTTVDTDININASIPCLAYYALGGKWK